MHTSLPVAGNQSDNLKAGGPLKRLYLKLHQGGVSLNKHNLKNAVNRAIDSLAQARGPMEPIKLLDLGCDDGAWTRALVEGVNFPKIDLLGLEKVEIQAQKASKLGLQVKVGDLSEGFPYETSSVDIVHSNQVIEHVPVVDHFVSEIFRILKPGGFFIVSSENGSAWHNVVAAIMGWQIFSLTNVSTRSGAIGNPLAAHRGSQAFHEAWTHKTIFNYLGFKELFEVHGFEDVQVLGAGYYPLPPIFGRFDPRHAHFITALGRKPDEKKS